jgi:hypothetical protein
LERRSSLTAGTGEKTVSDIADVPMTQIKSSVLEEMEPGESFDPEQLIERLLAATGFSAYDLEAALWYLIGDRRIRLDDHLFLMRVDEGALGER